ncbi:MAG: hypothetical protein LUD29_00950 [Clostridia bacterium]|nr:hypothetical protein [Clostridia bacterium]
MNGKKGDGVTAFVTVSRAEREFLRKKKEETGKTVCEIVREALGGAGSEDEVLTLAEELRGFDDALKEFLDFVKTRGCDKEKFSSILSEGEKISEALGKIFGGDAWPSSE